MADANSLNENSQQAPTEAFVRLEPLEPDGSYDGERETQTRICKTRDDLLAFLSEQDPGYQLTVHEAVVQ